MRASRVLDEGFTLVELMVVVLIIGILVSFAFAVFNAAAHKAHERTCHSNQRLIEGATQQYLDADGTRAMGDITIINGGLLDTDASPLIPEYILRSPRCPSDALPYSVDASGSATCPDPVALHGHYVNG